jgi:peptidoglycan hydrolase-like protein with peptidoglycan-binding domain
MRTPTRPLLAPLALALALSLATLAPLARAQDTSGGAVAPGGVSTSTATGSKESGGGASAANPGSARQKARGPAPVLTAALCYGIGKTRCHKKNRRIVQISGELVIHGHHFGGSITVYFQAAGVSAARVDPIGAPLRPTPHGPAVTVPVGAGSGRIYLENAAGQRSNRYGPLKIKPAPFTAVPTPALTPAGPSPFDGTGMWIWYMSQSDGGNLTAIAAQAKAAGITTLFIKSSDGPSDFWAQFTPTLVATLHSLGLQVCAWQYVYGADPAGEAAMGAEAVADGADCLVIDAESSYEGTGGYWAAQTYINDLRAAIGPNYPLGLTSFPYVNLHETEPYSVFLGPGGAQYNLPQIYWKDIGTSPDDAYAQTFVENRIYGRPVVPIGQSYNDVPPAQLTRFRQLASAYGAIGFSFYSWQATNTAGWNALDAPLATPTSPITLATGWPALSQGSKGDQVLWMQEHLAAAVPTTPTSGVFDATTEANLLAFQSAHGIPRSGITDPATWAALLELTPVPVVFPEPVAPTGPTGATGSSGSSGASGSSGSSGSSGASGASGSTGGGTSA